MHNCNNNVSLGLCQMTWQLLMKQTYTVYEHLVIAYPICCCEWKHCQQCQTVIGFIDCFLTSSFEKSILIFVDKHCKKSFQLGWYTEHVISIFFKTNRAFLPIIRQ